jgi:phosphate transport system protein
MHQPRTEFHRSLEALQEDVLVMGDMVDSALDRAMEALKQRDLEAARQIIKDDDAIDQKRVEIEEKALELIATQQPMASDLRILAAILSIISELERMGDHAEGICKIVILHGDEPHVKPLIDLPRMCLMSRDMLRRSLQAFINRDEGLARQVCNEDDRVDELWEQVWNELLLIMLQNPTTIRRATYLIWAGHNLERYADRATNIAERVVFLITGKLEELNLSRY